LTRLGFLILSNINITYLTRLGFLTPNLPFLRHKELGL
jgi:hypothetical protein